VLRSAPGSIVLFAACGAALLAGCPRPVPAPEGLDASSAYLVREFYAEDPVFEAGLRGYLRWFEDEGRALLDVENTVETVGEFELDTLTADDVDGLPLDHGGDISRAAGVVSLALMGCDVRQAEDLMLRRDQYAVFDDWEGFERDYLTSRSVFQAAWQDGFDPIPDPLQPHVGGFDGTPFAASLLQTMGQVDPAPVQLVGDFPAYPMHLDFRHGVYDIDGEDVQIFAILSFIEDEVWGPQNVNALHQSYAIELNVATAADETLRSLAVWIQGSSEALDIEPDNPIVLTAALNKSRKSSERMTAVCEGEFELGAEPSGR
jgi:hypothetical protein